MDFVFDLPKDGHGNTGIVVFVDQLSKMTHSAAVPDSIDSEGTAQRRWLRIHDEWQMYQME